MFIPGTVQCVGPTLPKISSAAKYLCPLAHKNEYQNGGQDGGGGSRREGERTGGVVERDGRDGEWKGEGKNRREKTRERIGRAEGEKDGNVGVGSRM